MTSSPLAPRADFMAIFTCCREPGRATAKWTGRKRGRRSGLESDTPAWAAAAGVLWLSASGLSVTRFSQLPLATKWVTVFKTQLPHKSPGYYLLSTYCVPSTVLHCNLSIVLGERSYPSASFY